jgi:DNA-binding transcriptional LysR family regulator
MQNRNIADIDFKLLVVFDAVLRYRSLTQAADNLGITQPAISKSIQRLREYFNDPLLVRTARGMEPTPRALAMAPSVKDILRVFREQLDIAPSFDPAQSDREFVFYVSDLGALIFLPRLLLELKRRAPHMRLRAVQIEQKYLTEALESGEVDLAIGAFPDLGAGFYQQRLYSESYICLVRKGHRATQGVFNLQRFLQESHIVVSAAKTGHVHRVAEQILLDVCQPERVALRVPSFLVPAVLLKDSDFVVTVPGKMGELLSRDFELAMLPCPVDIPGFEVKQYWHERFHHDPAIKWFRTMVTDLFMHSAG